jgi:hypothetical protein
MTPNIALKRDGRSRARPLALRWTAKLWSADFDPRLFFPLPTMPQPAK